MTLSELCFIKHCLQLLLLSITTLTSFSQTVPSLESDRFGQYYVKTENEGLKRLDPIRSNCEGSLHSSCLFPPLCSPSLEGKSQQIYPDPLRFCFRLFLFISAATWIQSFLLMIIMYGVKGNREKAALRNRLLRASINICLKRTEEKGKDKYTE